jgi:hypothetical protein
VEHLVSALADAARWDVGVDAEFSAMAEGLSGSAQALLRAAAASGAARAAALDDAKRLAADVERRRRAVRRSAHESPLLVDGLKREEVSARLSSAAEALQEACDCLAGSLAE